MSSGMPSHSKLMKLNYIFFCYRGQQINQKCCFQRWVYSDALPKSTASYGFSKFVFFFFLQSWMLDKIFLPKPPCAGRRWGLPMRDYILCSHAWMLSLAETHACSHSLCLSSHTYRQSHTLKWGGHVWSEWAVIVAVWSLLVLPCRWS